MSLVKTGGGVTDIRGGFGGVYFTKDKSGLHCTAKPRRVHQKTTGQKLQRDAFAAARRYSKDNRVVSYLMYRYMNGLPFLFDTKLTGNPTPDSTGVYTIEGQHSGEDYYERADSAWFIWWDGMVSWVVSQTLGEKLPISWFKVTPGVMGFYLTGGGAAGNVTLGLHIQPPPADYQIPKL